MTVSHEITELQSKMRVRVREHWKAFLIEGVLAGHARTGGHPRAATCKSCRHRFVGWLLLIGGIAGLVLTFWARQMPGFWWSLI